MEDKIEQWVIEQRAAGRSVSIRDAPIAKFLADTDFRFFRRSDLPKPFFPIQIFYLRNNYNHIIDTIFVWLEYPSPRQHFAYITATKTTNSGRLYAIITPLFKKKTSEIRNRVRVSTVPPEQIYFQH